MNFAECPALDVTPRKELCSYHHRLLQVAFQSLLSPDHFPAVLSAGRGCVTQSTAEKLRSFVGTDYRAFAARMLLFLCSRDVTGFF